MTYRQFYKSLTDFEPFPWQLELPKGDWKDITVPTGCGKTSVIIAWMYRLALGKAPTRLVYLVDRRMIVDDVFRYAAEAAAQLDKAEAGIQKKTADKIRAKFGVDVPIQVTRMRGGAWRDESWASSPAQPLIIASTVDQAGSRLLGRAYGCSRSMQVVSCGLLGNDCLYVVDESHLAQAFVANVRRVISMHKEHKERVVPAPVLVEMTATPRNPKDSIGLTDADRNPKCHLSARLKAKKPTTLKKVAVPESKEQHKRDAFAKGIHSVATKLEGNLIGVVVNSVRLAREVHARLCGSEEAILLTGRSRPHDRDKLFAEYRKRIRAGRDRKNDARLYVVATQCIEAGVDIDFDAMVTELASLDAIRQRAGRLNRLGELAESPCVIMARNDKIARGAKDWVYGDTLPKTWKWLSEQKNLDLGLRIKLPKGKDLDPLLAPTPEFDLLEQHDIDQLSMIQLPAAFPLDTFLHSRSQSQPIVSVCWRFGLGELEQDRLEEINSVINAVSPRSAEFCNVPIWDVQKWLPVNQPIIRWSEGGAEVIQARDVRSGDTIIVPSHFGGCDQWGWNPADDDPVVDIADDVAWRATGRKIERFWSEERPEGITRRFAGGWVVIGAYESHRLEEFSRVTPEERNPESVAVSLEAHSKGVSKYAEEFAPTKYKDAFGLAGKLHDAGKADPRWQYAIAGGKIVSELLAKSGNLTLHQFLAARERSGLPKGWRHETLSTRLAEDLTDDVLILHLIACHHGWGHPWVGLVADPQPPLTKTFKLCGFEVPAVSPAERTERKLVQLADRCSARYQTIQKQFGLWQRCYLEACLILADWRRSKEECEPKAISKKTRRF